MIKTSINFRNYYLNESEKLHWYRKPKIVFKKKANNHYSWFPDGQINLYENCITRNLKKNKDKIAIITVSQNKIFFKYTFEEIDKKVNLVTNYFKKFSDLKKLRIMIHASASIDSAVLMLASAKLGLHFSVIFEELEASGIKNRINSLNQIFFFQDLLKIFFLKKWVLKLSIKLNLFMENI